MKQLARSLTVSPEEYRLKIAWNQTKIPIVLRRGGNGEKLRVRLPFADDNYQWLRDSRRIKPEWIASEKYWELPKAWFNDFVDRSLEKYGCVYVVQPFSEQEICARACMEAEGHECQCSCMGANHGSGVTGSWFEVSDYFAIRSHSPKLACRLMTNKRFPK